MAKVLDENAALRDGLHGRVHEVAPRSVHRHGWSASSGPVGWRLLPDDLALLVSVARFGALTWRQCRDHFCNGSSRTANHRLSRLLRSGLLHDNREMEATLGRFYTITKRGVDVCRESMWFDLAPYVVGSKNLVHLFAVTDVGLQLESQGVTVVTEREVRFAELRHADGLAQDLAYHLVGDAARSVRDAEGRLRWLTVPAAESQLHYPDLVVVNDGLLWAVEVELTWKKRARVRSTLQSYVRSRVFDQVVWMGTPDVQRELRGGAVAGLPGGRAKGLLQELGMADVGDKNGWRGKRYVGPDGRGRGLFVVRDVPVADEGVMFEMDRLQLPRDMWLSKSAWRVKRAAWEADEQMGQRARVPFATWLVDVDGPLTDARVRAEVRERLIVGAP